MEGKPDTLLSTCCALEPGDTCANAPAPLGNPKSGGRWLGGRAAETECEDSESCDGGQESECAAWLCMSWTETIQDGGR